MAVVYPTSPEEIARWSARFWPHVIKSEDPDGCWLWSASIADTGYGNCSVDNHRRALAHRVSYILSYGAIPEGLLVCHKCDVRHCVRPDHLFLGSHKDNMQDCVRKGRLNPSGTKGGKFKKGAQYANVLVTADQVKEIRTRYRKGSFSTMKALANEYGIASETLRRIIIRQTWKDVP